MTGLDWTFTATWLVLWAGGLALLAWALFAGRAKGRPRCDRCRYSLARLDLPATTAEPPIPCPECGRPIRSLKQALRTRRRPIIAVFAVLLILAAPVAWRVPETMTRRSPSGDLEWLSLIPGPVLLGLLWIRGVGEQGDPLAMEADLRLDAGGVLAPSFASALAPALVRTRDRWPVGSPIAIFTDYRVRFVGIERAIDDPLSKGLDSYLRIQMYPPLRLAPLTEGRHFLKFEYNPVFMSENPLASFTREITVAGGLDSLLTPVTGPAVDAQVRDSHRVTLSIGPGWPADMMGVVWRRSTRLAFSTRANIELHRDGAIARADSFVLPTISGSAAHFAGTEVADLRRAIDQGDSQELARWSIVLTGDPAMALIEFDTTHYWSGTLRIPITEALKP